MAKMKNEIREKARKEVVWAKTAKDLNLLIAKYLEILERPDVTDTDIRLAITVSGLIGRQVSIENVVIAYERLASVNNKKYAFTA
jgi:hypothetical protein